MRQWSTANVNGVDQFEITWIAVLEQRHEPSGGDVGGDVKQPEPCNAGSGQHHLLHRLTVIDDQASGDRLGDLPARPTGRAMRAARGES